MVGGSSENIKKIVILAESGVVADVLIPSAVSKVPDLDHVEISTIYLPVKNKIWPPIVGHIQQIAQIRSRIGSTLRYLHGRTGFTTIPFNIKLSFLPYDTPVKYVEQSFNSQVFIDKLDREKPDYLLLLGCSQILDNDVIQVPKKDTINFHWSKLPSYRGRNATFWPVYNGESETGITFHSINKEIDQGHVILQKSVPISEQDDRHTVSRKCLQAGRQALSQLLKQINDGCIKRKSQIVGGDYYSSDEFKKIVFDPSETTRENLRRISAKGELMIKFSDGTELLATGLKLDSKTVPKNSVPGEVITISREGIHVVVDDGVVIITQCSYIPSIIISNIKRVSSTSMVESPYPT
jgi:methionyl-tRNA formyltransferase